jgi:hypothetical protein
MVISLLDTLHLGKLAATGRGVVVVVVVVLEFAITLTDRVMFKDVMLMEAEPDFEVMIEDVFKANCPAQLAPIPVMPRFRVVSSKGEYEDGKPVIVKS